MCGILAIFWSAEPNALELRALARKLSGRMMHRGPDWCGTKVMGRNAIGHERL